MELIIYNLHIPLHFKEIILYTRYTHFSSRTSPNTRYRTFHTTQGVVKTPLSAAVWRVQLLLLMLCRKKNQQLVTMHTAIKIQLPG